MPKRMTDPELLRHIRHEIAFYAGMETDYCQEKRNLSNADVLEYVRTMKREARRAAAARVELSPMSGGRQLASWHEAREEDRRLAREAAVIRPSRTGES